MDSDDGVCNTGLGLGLGSSSGHHMMRSDDQMPDLQENKVKNNRLLYLKYDPLLPSLTLGPSDNNIDDHDLQYLSTAASTTHHHDQTAVIAARVLLCGSSTEQISADLNPNRASSLSAVSSFSNSSTSVKRDKDLGGGGGGEEVEVEVETLERVSSRVMSTTEELDEEGSPRKKLRLTKEQSAVLEDSFKDHTTLNPKQKQELARKLNLRPRQVEVWFQNRRARTKLKQTEADYELLKKCCETLTEENKRLQKEVQELKSLKLTTPFFMQFPASATLTICPSCQRVCGGADGSSSTSASPFLNIGPKPHFSNPFPTHPSAAC